MTPPHYSRRLPLLVAMTALVCSGVARESIASQTRARADTSVYNVEAGGRSSVRELAGERVLELTDGVVITHGDVKITSRTGIHYSTKRKTVLLGDVVITQRGMTMRGQQGEYDGIGAWAVVRERVRIDDTGWHVDCDEARYYYGSAHAWLTGNVVARDSTTTLRADSVFYDRTRAIAEAFGDVEISSEKDGFTAFGKHGYYYRDERRGVLDRSPRLIVDPRSREPVTVDADTMRVYPDSSVAIAYYRVKIIKGNMVTQCDSAVVVDREQRAFLYGNPLARQDNVSMQAARMELVYDAEEVKRMDLFEGTIREAQRDTLVVGRESWIKGDTLALFLHDNRVDSIQVAHNAISEYFPTTPGKVERNFIRGDAMFFSFAHDSLSYVRVEGDAEGVYRYINVKRSDTPDSLRALLDTTLTYVPFDETAEKVVYSAKTIEYFAHTSDLVLNGTAALQYHQSKLTGSDITYYSRYELLDARGEPVLQDRDQKFYGERMNYDLEGETGLVVDGATQFGEGYYKGEYVARAGDDEMKVWNSTYTTCELARPHFHVGARQMKVYADDKVVSGPIWLYLGETPVFYLPFMANNIRRGRRSGFLRPDFEFGVTSSSGRYIRNIGYYWATNDYMDYTFVGDFNEDASFRLFTQGRYKVRYKLDGQFDFNMLRELENFTNQWQARVQHNQQDMPLGLRLVGDFNYVSDENVVRDINRIDQVDRYIDRSIRSNARLTRSWTSTSFSSSFSRTENLGVTSPTATKVTMTAPNLTVSVPSFDLYLGERSAQGREGLAEKMLSSMRLAPNISVNRQTTERLYDYGEDITLRTGLSLSTHPRIGFINIAPSISATDVATRTTDEIFAHTSVTPPDTVGVSIPYSRTVNNENEFSWGAGVQAGTNFYGTFYPRLGPIRGVRHRLSPAAGYNYAPANQGRPVAQSLGLSLQNSLDLKVATGDSTTSESGIQEEAIRKLSGVLLWNLASNYNPTAAAGKNWGDIRSNLTTQFSGISLSLNQTFGPYDLEVVNSDATVRFSLSGSHPFGRSSEVDIRERNVVAASDTSSSKSGAGSGVGGATVEQTGDYSPQNQAAGSRLQLRDGWLPWRASVDLGYSTSRLGDTRSTMRFTGSMNITRSWQFTYSSIYDIMEGRQSGQNISIARDLHCWRMSLARQKLGAEWQYYFRIELKAHPDLYGESGQRGLGGGTLGTGSWF